MGTRTVGELHYGVVASSQRGVNIDGRTVKNTRRGRWAVAGFDTDYFGSPLFLGSGSNGQLTGLRLTEDAAAKKTVLCLKRAIEKLNSKMNNLSNTEYYVTY